MAAQREIKLPVHYGLAYQNKLAGTYKARLDKLLDDRFGQRFAMAHPAQVGSSE